MKNKFRFSILNKEEVELPDMRSQLKITRLTDRLSRKVVGGYVKYLQDNYGKYTEHSKYIRDITYKKFVF